VINNPIKYIDPSGYKWTCIGANQDHCYDDGNFDYGGSNGGLSGMAKNDGDQNSDDQSWQRIGYFLDNLKILGNTQSAMEYYVAKETGKGRLSLPDSKLFTAITRKYYEYCDGNPWSATCVQSFWGYIEGIRNGYELNENEKTQNHIAMASAILHPGQSYIGIGTNHYKIMEEWTMGCGNLGLCEWSNPGKNVIGAIQKDFNFTPYEDGAFFSDINSITMYWLSGDNHSDPCGYFLVMSLSDKYTYEGKLGGLDLCQR
jgi:hypothetical protein